jgi:hypothetical protein
MAVYLASLIKSGGFALRKQMMASMNFDASCGYQLLFVTIRKSRLAVVVRK